MNNTVAENALAAANGRPEPNYLELENAEMRSSPPALLQRARRIGDTPPTAIPTTPMLCLVAKAKPLADPVATASLRRRPALASVDAASTMIRGGRHEKENRQTPMGRRQGRRRQREGCTAISAPAIRIKG